MCQTEAIILYSCQGLNRIKLHYSSYCENLGRKLQLNGRNRDLCIPLLLYFRNSGTSDGTEENYSKNHFIAENNNDALMKEINAKEFY